MQWYESLPIQQRIATTSPYYVFADAQRDQQLQPCFVGYQEDGHIWLHGFHLSSVAEFDIVDCQAPYGYGCLNSNCSEEGFIQRAWSAYLALASTNGWLAEFTRLHPMDRMPQLFQSGQIDDRQTVAINTSRDIDIRSNYSTRCRTAVRKAIKNGVSSRVGTADEIRKIFPAFYREGMQQIGADTFYLFNDAYFEAFANWGKAELVICEKDERWLSAGLFLSDGEIMEYHLSATSPAGRTLGATNLLLDSAAHIAQQENQKWLYLGGGTNNDKENPLYFFKKGFSEYEFSFKIGFVAFDVERYARLKQTFMQAGKLTNRFLFYRN
jgi:hypothetical protein